MSQYEGISVMSKSTFLPPHTVDNVRDVQKIFEHSHDSDDIRRYKSLMMPPKSKNQMLHDVHIQQQEEENKTVEFGSNVKEAINTNNSGDINLTEGTST